VIQTDIQIDRQTDRRTYREADEHKDRHTDKQTIQRGKETERYTKIEKERQAARLVESKTAI
jgi:hypothetical protein